MKIMHSKFLFFTFILCFLMIGCSLVPNEIKTAQKIMDTNPDSALHILQKMQPSQTLTNANRALYGVVLFQALDKNDKTLQPDSVITFSVNYYQNTNDKQHLANAYYYKALLFKKAQQFDQATILYLKALDLIRNEKKFKLLGKIYSDMGDICSFQKDFNEALKKYNESINNYEKAGDTLEASYKVIDIARMYRFMKDYQKARMYYKQSLSQSEDSVLHGLTYQEIGINYYFAKQYDSARYFLKKSLLYPYKGTNYALRCYNLADLYFDINKYDSALQYANKALKYPNTFFSQRECYRILTNTEYSRRDLKQMAIYMSKYQDCSDSVRKIEIQTKTTVLEDLHQKSKIASNSLNHEYIVIFSSVVILIIGLFLYFKLLKGKQRKEVELDKSNKIISKNQTHFREELKQKILLSKNEKTASMKKLSVKEKETAIIETYNKCLQIQYWDKFSSLMNQTFNNIIVSIETNYPAINHNEIIWICLFLLDVPLTEIALVLDCEIGSLYKLKQRIAQKMNLTSSKDLEIFLQKLSSKT